MTTFTKFIIALGVSMSFALPMAMAQIDSDPEVKEILAAAKAYAKGSTEDKFDFKFKKRVGTYALIKSIPKPKYINQFEAADIIVQKVGGKWVGKGMGTALFEWEQKVPELFK